MWIEHTNSVFWHVTGIKWPEREYLYLQLEVHFQLPLHMYFSLLFCDHLYLLFFKERQYQVDGVGGGKERLLMPILHSSSFQSSFHPLSYKNENLHKTLAG